MKLDLHKIVGSARVVFSGPSRLFLWSTYEVSLHDDLLRKATADDVCKLTLTHEAGGVGGVVFAECELEPDPLRRDVRAGVLVIGDDEHAALFGTFTAAGADGSERFTMRVAIGEANDVLVHQDVAIVMTPDAVRTGGGPAPSSSRWTVVDGGVPASMQLSLGDMTQTSYDISGKSGVISLSPTVAGIPVAGNVPFEAYMQLHSSAGLSGVSDVVMTSGESIVWDYQDSKDGSSTDWTVHLQSISGVWHATMRANQAQPLGSEIDPDDVPVPGAGVNR